MKIVYFVGGMVYVAGMESILSKKINYLAQYHDVYMILTEGKGKPFSYEIDNRVNIVNFDLDFNGLYRMPMPRRIFAYLSKQRKYKRMATDYLMMVKPDISISVCRREINFINSIKDGSKKIGELHFEHRNYRRYENKYLPTFVNSLISKLWIRSFEREVAKLDRFVVLSQEDALTWTNLSNLVVIPNFYIKQTDKTSLCERKQVIAVGRYTYQKGFDILIQAWAKARKDCPEWSLHIYGYGDSVSYQKMANDQGLGSSLVCHNATKDIFSLYLDSSIFVMSSRFEGFPMVLPEAMSFGLPCVSFACPCGPRDIITDGEDGLLVENGNVDQLADKLVYLMTHDEERKTMGKRAAENIKRLEIDKIMAKWDALFRSII